MKPELREKLRNRAALSGLFWSLSGFAAALFPVQYGLNLPEGWLNWTSFGLTAVYLGALAYMDYLLLRIRSPGANRLMTRYWGLSALGLFLWLLGGRPLWNSEQGGALTALTLLCAFTPFSAVLPLSRSCLSCGIWSTIVMTNTIAALGLSLAELLFFSLLRRRGPGAV